jgi:hypothetical protein
MRASGERICSMHKSTLLPCCSLVLLGCGIEPPGLDRTAPAVENAQPQSIAVDGEVAVTFTEAVELPITGAGFLIPRSDLNSTFIDDLLDGKLIAKNTELTWPTDIALDAKHTLVVTPQLALPPSSSFVLWLPQTITDVAGNPLQPTTIDVDTRPLFPTPALALTEPSPALQRFTIAFDTDITATRRNTPLVSAEPPVHVTTTLLDARTLAVAVVGDAPCALAPNTTYAWTVSDVVVGVDGQAMRTPTVSFTTTSVCDGPIAIDQIATQQIGNRLLIDVTTSRAAEVAIVVDRIDDNEPNDAAYTVDDNGRIIAPTTDGVHHHLPWGGLVRGATYHVVVQASDAATSTLDRRTEEVTLANVPLLRITEVLANPAATPENRHEYVEVHNDGAVDVDAAGLRLHVDNASCDLAGAFVAGQTTVIAASGFADAIDVASSLLLMTTSTVCAPLPNEQPMVVALSSENGALLDRVSLPKNDDNGVASTIDENGAVCAGAPSPGTPSPLCEANEEQL